MPADLSVTYLGLNLRTPFVPSASPKTEHVSEIRRFEDAGASAVVMHSLFEEQIRSEQIGLEHGLSMGADSNPEGLSYFPDVEPFKVGPDQYCEHIAEAKASVAIPVIASLNAASPGAWIDYARQIEQAGADAIELNIYRIPTDPRVTSETIEDECVEIFRRVRATVRIPVAVKLAPFYTNFARMAQRLDDEGADGLVLFNRFYQPDIDLEALDVSPRVLLSNTTAMRLPMRWIAILYGRIGASMAATSGIHRASDALKMLMAGADVTMLCSVLLRRGAGFIGVLERETQEWLDEHECESVRQIQGSLSQMHCPNPAAFERAQYVRAVTSLSHDLSAH